MEPMRVHGASSLGDIPRKVNGSDQIAIKNPCRSFLDAIWIFRQLTARTAFNCKSLPQVCCYNRYEGRFKWRN